MLRNLIEGLADLVYPKVCLACKNKITAASVDGLICAQCWSRILKTAPPFCQSCGRRLGEKALHNKMCPACIKTRLHFDRAFSPCSYEGVIENLVQEFKYKGKDHLALPLSKLMVQFIKEFNLPMHILDFIIPVPLHDTKMREREFNQAELLCRHISREFNKELIPDILKRTRDTKTQTGLKTSERYANVKESFSVEKTGIIKGKNILLVDDVLTTGATCSEAARTLKNSGAAVVFALTLAN